MSPRGRLRGEIVPVDALAAAETSALYELYRSHYDAVEPVRFEEDLREKDHVLLLLDSTSGEVRGFSTQKVFRATDSAGEPVRVLFSGDTIIAPEYWGEQELVRTWCRYAGRALSEDPGTPLYWLLISKGHRTYLYLPLFFEKHWPRYDEPTPPYEAGLLARVARARFGESFDESAGLLRFPESLGQLKPGLAAIPSGRIEDPRVRFFLEKNPRYSEGEELVCLARFAPELMRGIAARSAREGVAEGGRPRGARATGLPAICWTS